MAIIRSVIVAARISSLQAAFSRLTGLGSMDNARRTAVVVVVVVVVVVA